MPFWELLPGSGATGCSLPFPATLREQRQCLPYDKWSWGMSHTPISITRKSEAGGHRVRMSSPGVRPCLSPVSTVSWVPLP